MPKKSPVFIPAPTQSAPGFRCHPSSKHAKGRAAKTYRGQVEFGNGSAGQFGGSRQSTRVKKTWQRKLLDESQRIDKGRALKLAFAQFRKSLSPADLAFARKHGIHQPSEAGSEFGKPGETQPDVEFLDPAEMPEASYTDHPVDRLEPKSPFAVAVARLGSAEITDAADCFADALTWALDVPNLRDVVTLGRRALLLILRLRPDLVQVETGMYMRAIDLTDAWASSHSGKLHSTGEIFGRVLEWVRRGDLVSEIGERLALVAYVVRPAMIDSPTLEELGEITGKTRQAKDKLVQCLRDTFAGLKAVAMRGEATRARCQAAHA